MISDIITNNCKEPIEVIVDTRQILITRQGNLELTFNKKHLGECELKSVEFCTKRGRHGNRD